MSKQASKTVIGAFVVGALVLAVAGILIFGSGKFLSKRLPFVMFFDGSVKGLQVGAPVVFRGVKIGEVTRIGLQFNPEDLTVWIPVYVEIDPDKFMGTVAKQRVKPYQYYQALIDKGLKAQLQLQSFVTGQLMIGADFYPDKPIRLVGLDKKYHEIPTTPSSMAELTKTVENLPLKEITEKLDSVLEGADKLVHSPELTASIASLHQMLKDTDTLVKRVDARVGPLTASLTGASDAARGALVQAEKTLAMNEGMPGELSASLKETLKSMRSTLADTQTALNRVSEIAAQNANIGYEISVALEQMTALSRSIRVLTTYLDQHPEALIRGKRPPKGE